MTTSGPLPTLLRLTDIATRYELSIDTLYDWARSGELRAFKLGRTWMVHPDDWQTFIDARRTGAA